MQVLRDDNNSQVDYYSDIRYRVSWGICLPETRRKLVAVCFLCTGAASFLFK